MNSVKGLDRSSVTGQLKVASLPSDCGVIELLICTFFWYLLEAFGTLLKFLIGWATVSLS